MHYEEWILLLLGLLLLTLVVLRIVAIVRTSRIGRLERRLQGVETALRRTIGNLESLRSAGAVPQEGVPKQPAAKPASPLESEAIPTAAGPSA